MKEKETVQILDSIYLTGYKDEYVFTKIKQNKNFYENIMLEKWAGEHLNLKVIYDIGANLGNHSVFFSKVSKAKEIYSFEPVGENYDLLLQNIEMNLIKEIKPFNFALGSKSGKANMYFSIEGNFGTATIGGG